jgi:hypothetical protein
MEGFSHRNNLCSIFISQVAYRIVEETAENAKQDVRGKEATTPGN